MRCAVVCRPSFLHLLLALILLLITCTSLARPQVEFGDGREYIIQTQSIVFDHQLAVDPERRAPYWNSTNPFGLHLYPDRDDAPRSTSTGKTRQFEGNFGGLYFDRDGALRYIHAWVYSLAVAPVYALMHALGIGSEEYRAFTVANLIFLFVPLALLWRERPSLWTLLYLLPLLASPVTPHLQFAHAEIFCLSCIMMSFLSIEWKGWRFLSPLVLGIGAAQNIPIALFFPLHLWLTWSAGGKALCPRDIVRLVVPYLLAVALPLLMMAYSFAAFGTGNLIAQLGFADVSFLSIRRMMSVFFSPIIGNVWYLPASWLALVIACVCGRGWLALWFGLSILLVSALSSTTNNLNSAQISSCRYAVWYLAPLYTLPFLQLSSFPTKRISRLGRGVLMAASALVLLIQIHLGTWRLISGESSRFNSLRRTTLEVAALYRFTHFDDDIEPLVENIVGAELPIPRSFDGIYVWNIGEGESVWILSKRALRRSSQLEVRVSSDITTDAAITSLFSATEISPSVFVLTVRPDVSFERHPVFGGYLTVWASTTLLGARSEAPVVVKQIS